MATSDVLHLMVKIKPEATIVQAANIRKLINIYSSKRKVTHYADGSRYDIEAPDGMAIQLDKDLRAYRDVVIVEFVKGEQVD